jgi:hypothetical protein
MAEETPKKQTYYHSRIENLSDASDTHFGTYNAALDRASLQYGKENIKSFYSRALEEAYDTIVEELNGLEYVVEDGEYTLPSKNIQFSFEHFNKAVPPKSQELQFLIELDGYQGINLYVLDDGYPIEIERFDAGGLLYDAEEEKIKEFRDTDAEYVFGRKEDFATTDVYVSRIQDGVPVDVYEGDFDIDSKYNLYEMKIKPDAKVFDMSGKEIEIVNTFRKQGESTYNTKSNVVSSEFLQYELFAENAPGLGKVSEIKIDGVSYKPESGVFQNKEEIIQVLADDADVIIYTNEIEDAGSSSLYVRNADAVDVSLVDEERLNVFNEDVNTKYYQTSPLDEDLLRKLDQGKITQEQYEKYKQPFTDTPTNVVDDITMKPIFVGTEAPPTGNSFVYADVEEIFDFVQFNRRNNPTQTGTTFSSDQIDAIKKTILEKGYIYDTGEFYNSAVVFPVSVDISGEIQIGEGNHRLLAAYEVAKETGQKIYVPIHVYTGGVVKGGQNQTRLVDRKNLYNALKELFKDVGASEYTINNKIGETFDSVKQYGGANYLGSGGSGGNSTSQENIKKFFSSIGVDTFTYQELPEDNVFKTGVNTLTDTPTNVVDDGPALLETRIQNNAQTERTTTLLPEWKSDVVKPNKIFAPNKMETNKTNISQLNKFRSGEEVLNAIKAGTATDEDITRFFIYLASKSPHKIYAYKPMSNADAVADIVKIGIFSERPLDELLPLTNKDPELTAKYNLVLDNNYVLRDLDRKIILDLINEQGQFNNLKERMRNTLIDAHNKIYAPNPNDYFFLWRGGGLSRFNTWQSFSKRMQSASGVMYQLKSTGIVPLEGGVNTYVINKNNMIDLDSLGLSHGNEQEIIVLTEAANKPGAKLPKDKVYDTGLDNPRKLKNYIDNWALKAREPEFFPKNGFVIENISTQLNELGQSTQNFFNDLISGMNPDLKPNKPYEQIIELNNSQLQNAQDIYNKYIAQGGDFNPHYFTSIPTVYETQIVKAQALSNMLDKHDKVINDTGTIKILDIGGTEGAWSNTLAEIGGEKVYVEIIEPSPEANKLYNEIQTPNNTRFRNEAFSYIIEDQGKFFNEPNSIKFSEFFAGGTIDSNTGIRNPDVQMQGGKYDVVHEAMAFQFVDANRQAQIDFIADNVLADDGILLIEEKFTNNDVIYQNNEKIKDDFKRLYYTEEQINSKAQNIVGPMGDKQVSVQEIENILGNRFKYVNQYWDSGNFKGYIASNNPLSETFVDEIHALDTSLTNHIYSTAPTQEELKYAVQKDMRNRGIDIELAKDFAKRFVEGNKKFVQSASDALSEVYKVGKAVGPAVGSLALRGLSKAAPVLAPGDVLVEGALAKTVPYVDDFAKRLGFASLPAAQIINAYVAADIGAAGAEIVSAAMYAYDESQKNAPQQGSKFQESLTKFLLPKAYEDEAVQKLQIPQDLESFYRTPAGQQFVEDNDFGSLFKKQLEQEKLTKYSPGWQLSKAIFSLFGSIGKEQANISEQTRGNMGQALLTGIGK